MGKKSKLKKKINSFFLKKILNDVLKIFFISSVIFYLTHEISFFRIFNDIPILIMKRFESNSSKNSPDTLKSDFIEIKSNSPTNRKDLKVYVSLINEKMYMEDFHTISPLERCKLLSKIKEILKLSPDVLVIDLDISPLPISKNEKNNPIIDYINHQNSCTDEIKKYISINSSTKFILISPKYFNMNFKNIENWESDLRNLKNVSFASPNIFESFGIVYRYLTFSSGEKTLALESLCSIDKKYCNEHGNVHMNFSTIEIIKGDSQHIDKNNKRVIFIGTDYDPRDKFTTPIEDLPGVMIHAIGFMSFIYKEKESHIIGYSIDALIGFLTLFIMKTVWKFSFRNRNKNNIARHLDPFLLLASVAILLISGIMISYLFFKKYSIIISSFPIILGVLFDSLHGTLKEECEENIRKIENDDNNNRIKNGFQFNYLTIVIKILFILYCPFYLVLFGH